MLACEYGVSRIILGIVVHKILEYLWMKYTSYFAKHIHHLISNIQQL